MTDNKCPECKGQKILKHTEASLAATNKHLKTDVKELWYDCPACNGTGGKKLDRPELPKEIPALCIVNMVEGRGYPRCIEPLIEEAKREERKRIIEVIENLNSIGYPYGGTYKAAVLITLKEEKEETHDRKDLS